MLIGIPVIDQHELTQECVKFLLVHASDPQRLHVCIIDNGSAIPYQESEFNAGAARISVLRNKHNKGFYYPLKEMHELFGGFEGMMGLMHNDLFIYEKGWDEKMRAAFVDFPELALIGLCGSSEADSAGGRGGGTMCHFRGERGQSQDAGLRITDLVPALLLDSLFMLFRTSDIPLLQIDKNIAPCHFYDKIWSIRMVEHGRRVAVLGAECDHIGGQTAGGDKYNQVDAVRWCNEQGLPIVTSERAGGKPDADMTVYLEAERRFLTEYRDTKKMIPCKVDGNWMVTYVNAEAKNFVKSEKDFTITVQHTWKGF